jgi:hypothetical protein
MTNGGFWRKRRGEGYCFWWIFGFRGR